MKTRILGIVAVCAAAGVLASAGTWLLLTGGAGDGTPAASAPVASAQVPAAQDGPGKDGTMRSGISVRGHWVIEVRNPDGTLDRREEFDNALMDEGSALHTLLTTHRWFAGWTITLAGGTTVFEIEEPTEARPSGTQVGQKTWSLTATPVDESPGGKMTRLAGSVIVPQAVSLGRVSTYLNLCAVPSCTVPDFAKVLTIHDLPQDIPVLAGQQVLVTVEISFAAI